MKRILLGAAVSCVLAFTACKKTSFNGNSAMVVRDCTGTYLRVDGKDYHVCNLEKVAAFADGVLVRAAYQKTETCNGSANAAVTCMMLHANEGWIEVQSIQ